MKFYITLVLVMVAATLGYSQDVESATGSFGLSIKEKGAVSASKLPGKMKGAEAVDIKVKGEITEVCQAKGCWMTLDMGGGEILRVKFKDYAFFVPKNAAGNTAIVQGTANKETISVDELRHLAEDAGKSENEINSITNPKEELTFVAEGVIIR
jgi:hypothetical protein